MYEVRDQLQVVGQNAWMEAVLVPVYIHVSICSYAEVGNDDRQYREKSLALLHDNTQGTYQFVEW